MKLRKLEIVRSEIDSDRCETIKEFTTLEEAQAELIKYKNNSGAKYTIKAYTVNTRGDRVTGSELHIREKL